MRLTVNQRVILDQLGRGAPVYLVEHPSNKRTLDSLVKRELVKWRGGRTGWPRVEPVIRHGCGMCDAAIRFDGIQAGVACYSCTVCDWTHVAIDCCETR